MKLPPPSPHSVTLSSSAGTRAEEAKGDSEPAAHEEENVAFLQNHVIPEAWICSQGSSWGTLPTFKAWMSTLQGQVPRGGPRFNTHRTLWPPPNYPAPSPSLCRVSESSSNVKKIEHMQFPLLHDPSLHPDSITTRVRMPGRCCANQALLTPCGSYTQSAI